MTCLDCGHGHGVEGCAPTLHVMVGEGDYWRDVAAAERALRLAQVRRLEGLLEDAGIEDTTDLHDDEVAALARLRALGVEP